MKSHTTHNHEHAHHAFDNPEMFAKKFDSAERDAWQKPGQVINSLNLPPSAVVAEIGAGTGYFTLRLAKHLKEGKVIAIDASPKMAEYLTSRLAQAKLSNVDVRLSEDAAEIPLQEKVDLIMCVDVYHHLADRIAYFSHLTKHLKPDGKIVILERPPDSPEGPPTSRQIPPELVKQEMSQAGFKLAQELDFLLPSQFYLAFKAEYSTAK